MAFSVREMASRLGVSKSQVDRDKREGMPMGDVEAARAWREQHRDVARSADGRIDRPTLAPPPRVLAPPPEGPASAEGEEDAPRADDTAEYRRHRTERERLRREREQLELDRDRGRVVDAENAARLAFTTFRRLRDLALNQAPALAVQVVGVTDLRRIEELYQDTLNKVFAAFDEHALMRENDDDDDASG